MQVMIAALENTEDFADRRQTGAAFQAYMAPWFTFTEALSKGGVMRGGNALETADTATCLRLRDGKRIVEDGPYAESKEQLGGYFIVEVEDLAEAVQWAAQCPSMKNGAVAVLPIANYAADASR